MLPIIEVILYLLGAGVFGGLGAWILGVYKARADKDRIVAEGNKINAEANKLNAETNKTEADADAVLVSSASTLIVHYEHRLARLETKVDEQEDDIKRFDRKYRRALDWIQNAIHGFSKLHHQISEAGGVPVWSPPEFKEEE